jgi:magnesium transporter
MSKNLKHISHDHSEPTAVDGSPSQLAAAEQTELVKSLALSFREDEKESAKLLVAHIHSADLADIFELLDGQTRKWLAEILRDTMEPDLLTELEGQAFEDVISVLDTGEIADAVASMDMDDAVYVLDEMGEGQQQQDVLEAFDADERVLFEQAFTYPQDSAGRLMQREFVAVPSFWTVAQALDYLRCDDSQNKDFWEIFVVDPQHHPIGTIPLGWILRSDVKAKVSDIMAVEQTLIPVDMDKEEVAYLFRQYSLVSAAVVDYAGRLVGMLTVDDMVDVMEDEAGEDILALGGVKDGDINISIKDIAKARFSWLLVNLVTAILASIVIAMFGENIEKLVALAILMPIVASMGGNAGTQTMTVTVRALATKEITPANAYRVVGKEFIVSIINGIILASIMGVLASYWFSNPLLGWVIAAAMVINLAFAGLSGILIPLGLNKYGIDPAVSSSVFVTTVTDVIGFLAFLGLAAVFLI